MTARATSGSPAPLDPVALSLEGIQLIEASAGTGKTHTIGTLWLRLLVERDMAVENVLVVTFTRAATAELRQKLRRRLRAALAAVDEARHTQPGARRVAGARSEADAVGGATTGAEADEVDATSASDELTCLVARWRAAPGIGLDAAHARLAAALGALDTAPITTIHGFCQRTLLDLAFESGMPFDASFVEDDRALLDEVVADWWVTALHAARRDVVAGFLGRFRTPAALAKWVRQATAAAPPHLVGLAPFDDEAAFPDADAAWAAAFAGAAAAWRAAAPGAIEALLTRGDLNGGVYKPAQIRATWLPSVAAFFDVDRDVPAAEPDCLPKLGAGRLAAKTNKNRTTPEHPFFDACEALVAAAEDAALRVERAVDGLALDAWTACAAAVAERKARRGLLAFDDLLRRLDAALAADERRGGGLASLLRKRLPAALIDEFQDTDPVQYRIFRRIYGAGAAGAAPGTLLLIGDPKQAIYGFRGADIFAYFGAVEDAAGASWTLGRNWRSDPGLVEAVNHLFGRHARPFLQRHVRFAPIAPRSGAAARLRAIGGGAPPAPLELLCDAPADAPEAGSATIGDFERAVPRAVAGEIVRLLERGLERAHEDASGLEWRPVAPGDVAVLVRTNRQAEAVRRALEAVGVPSVLHGDRSVLDTVEAEEMARVMAAMAAPSDTRAVRAALTTTAMGLDAAALVALAESEAAWEAEGERFAAWHETWAAAGFIQAFRRWLADADVPARVLARPGGERHLTNLLHLAELLHGVATDARLGIGALVAWLARARADAAAGPDAATAQIRLERDAEAVQVVTIHRSKGLEYPIVLCPYLWAKDVAGDPGLGTAFHDPDAGHALTLSLGAAGAKPPEAHVARAEDEALAEGLRLLYVALTRARHACLVMWGAVNDAEKSALAYLLHPEAAPDGAEEAGGTGDDESARRQAARAAAAAARKGGPSAMRAPLDAAAARAPAGCIAVRALEAGRVRRWRGADESVAERAARPMPKAARAAWRSASYTGLARGAFDAAAPAPARDHDEAADDGVPGAAVVEAPDARLAERVPLAEFPAGPRPGQRVHEILEHVAFDGDDAALARTIARHVDGDGAEAGWAEALTPALGRVLDTPLDAAGLRLRGVERRARIAEMAFTLPVDAARRAPLTARALADALEAAPGPGLPAAYPDALRRLGFAPLTGFLAGFVDLVFRAGDRWHVVDWKTNRLGARYGHYRPAALAATMTHHHYVLQYHLYLVALHRYLARRVPGYDYDRHVGGAYYLFVRGMRPDFGPACGVFHDRPPRALVERLDALLGPGEAGP